MAQASEAQGRAGQGRWVILEERDFPSLRWKESMAFVLDFLFERQSHSSSDRDDEASAGFEEWEESYLAYIIYICSFLVSFFIFFGDSTGCLAHTVQLMSN